MWLGLVARDAGGRVLIVLGGGPNSFLPHGFHQFQSTVLASKSSRKQNGEYTFGSALRCPFWCKISSIVAVTQQNLEYKICAKTGVYFVFFRLTLSGVKIVYSLFVYFFPFFHDLFEVGHCAPRLIRLAATPREVGGLEGMTCLQVRAKALPVSSLPARLSLR